MPAVQEGSDWRFVWRKAVSFIRGLRSSEAQSTRASGQAELSTERDRRLAELESRIHYRFKDRNLLDQALTHRSFAYEAASEGRQAGDYESLEFLGDSILGFLIAEFLYLTYFDLSEGEYTKIRAHLVSTRQLSSLSRTLGLGAYMNFSRGEEKTGGRNKRAILADVFESLVAAVYLDGEMNAAREFVLTQFEPRFAEIARGDLTFRDYKSALQECLHRLGHPSPRYRVLKEIGPEHRKEFLVSVSCEGRELSRGSGRTKKEAEQQAAERTLQRLRKSGNELPVNDQGEDVVGGVSDHRSGDAPSPDEKQAED